MLIFTRRTGEQLRIGSDIVLTVDAITHGEVCISIEASSSRSIFTSGLGQVLNIGGSILVTVLVLRKREVRLGIETRLKIPVYREEYRERILQSDNRLSPQTTRDPSF